ncbi:hypothetical protein A2899_01460 [Candidatus Amesbacteria bacterium RIFCSPLOWO2_01_FULL_49_25]|nr:MAG: hypothetical protein A2899_01460 [Candidatus Amesbacteria bacterium RIFCSPLOWO2_01_FULL_49_25]
MADELLDLVNDKDEVVGTVLKSRAHQDPKLIHREIAIAVFNNKGEVLLQQRSMNKANDPGKWTITAAGHVGAGENPKGSAKREVKEELGIGVEPIYVEKEFSTHKDKDARFFWIYYATMEGDPRLVLDKEEVMDAKWVSVKKLAEFSKHNYFPLDSGSYKFISKIAKTLKLI